MADPQLEELALIKDLALQAGQLLLQEQEHIGTISYKSATEIVTDLDRRVEERLVTSLARHFPADTFLAEEGSGGGTGHGRVWYIDPLDGTTNYVHGYPFYAVSLGCASGQELLLGTVYAPYLDELYSAVRDGGAVLERPGSGYRRDLSHRQKVVLARALLGTGFPYERDEVVDRNTEYLRRFLRARCHGVRRAGSAAIDLCHVAAGKLDGFWEMKLRPWDVAAGTLMAREAGAVVTDFAGRQGRLDGATILAAAPGLYDEMMAVVGEK